MEIDAASLDVAPALSTGFGICFCIVGYVIVEDFFLFFLTN